jgi:hypothetical protein
MHYSKHALPKACPRRAGGSNTRLRYMVLTGECAPYGVMVWPFVGPPFRFRDGTSPALAVSWIPNPESLGKGLLGLVHFVAGGDRIPRVRQGRRGASDPIKWDSLKSSVRTYDTYEVECPRSCSR